MFNRSDAIAALVAVALHAGVAYGLARVPERSRKAGSILEIEVRKPAPPPPVAPLTPPEPPRPVPPPKLRPKVAEAPPPPSTPPPNQQPAEPPKEPPKPVFGVTMSSVTEGGTSGFAVPVGNTTMIDPKKSGPHDGPLAPLPAAPPKPAYQPVGDLYVKSLPDHDSDLCSRSIPYPEDAQEQGIEGEVILRVSLDEKGKVVEVKVLSGPGHGLNEAAANAIRHKCRFGPAIATDGRAVPYVIQRYKFSFEINR